MKKPRREINPSSQNWYDKYKKVSTTKKRPKQQVIEYKKPADIFEFSNQGYTLQIKREDQRNGAYTNSCDRIVSISLYENDYKGHNEELYERTYKQIDNQESKIRSAEALNTYGKRIFSNHGIKKNTYCFQMKQGCIYGINEIKKPIYPMIITGLCVENAHIPFKCFLPAYLELREHSSNAEQDLESFMIFKEYYKEQANYIEIKKRGFYIDIIFYSKNSEMGETEPVIRHLIADSNKIISENDIEHIQNELKMIFFDYPFVDIVIEELEQFKMHLTKTQPEIMNPQYYLDYYFPNLNHLPEIMKRDLLRKAMMDFKEISQDQSICIKGITRNLKRDTQLDND